LVNELCEYDMIYLSTAVGLKPGGSITVHIYTWTIHRTTQITKTQITIYLIYNVIYLISCRHAVSNPRPHIKF